MMRIREPAVAGMFYPAEPEDLSAMVKTMLRHAKVPETDISPKALIAPHAGYIYSGPTAGYAYALLGRDRDAIRRIVLLGPVHRVPVRGLALPDADAFTTPLGTVPLDKDGMQSIADLPQVVTSKAAHAMEHSLEVHIPFLQETLDDFTLIPLAVGDATPEEVAEVLDRLWGGDETRIVISSDLSHYLPYDMAKRVDEQTARAILDLRWPIRHEQACGATPINGLLASTKGHGLEAHLLDLRNSGDTAGDKSQVVGYGAFAFTPVQG
jgi:hypothetical protein